MSTISDVAAKAGVSAATVSRVLSGKPQVADNTRQRVLTAAAELGYSPSRAAQALARGRSTSIGVVVPLATSPSVAERLEGLSARLSPSGYDLSLFNVRARSEASDILVQLADPERVGAVVIVSMKPSREEVQALQRAKVPVVLIDAQLPDVDCVFIDDAEGGRLAARALLTSGHRRIAFVGDAENGDFGFSSSETRRAAFEDILATASLRIRDEYLKRGDHGSAYAREATFELLALDQPPTAIFAASDSQAIGVLEAAHERGVAVPHDLSVIGFDDIRSARGMGLTTIRQPLEESGAYGAKLVLEAIEHQPMGMAIELPLTLINRRSTGPPAVNR
jgi:DNA-binding LacI/PurR family transcriptional regulator